MGLKKLMCRCGDVVTKKVTNLGNLCVLSVGADNKRYVKYKGKV